MGILENGSETSDASLGDGFEDDFGLVEADLDARVTNVETVGDLHTVERFGVFGVIGDFFTGKFTVVLDGGLGFGSCFFDGFFGMEEENEEDGRGDAGDS